MGSLITLLMDKLNVQLKILANKINTATLHPINTHLKNFFYGNQMHYNNRLQENIFKMQIQRNIHPTDHPPPKKKLIIYYNNSVINNNFTPSIRVLQKKKKKIIILQFKCPFGDCISENKIMYVGLTSTTLSKQLTWHLSNISSILTSIKLILNPVLMYSDDFSYCCYLQIKI